MSDKERKLATRATKRPEREEREEPATTSTSKSQQSRVTKREGNKRKTEQVDEGEASATTSAKPQGSKPMKREGAKPLKRGMCCLCLVVAVSERVERSRDGLLTRLSPRRPPQSQQGHEWGAKGKASRRALQEVGFEPLMGCTWGARSAS